LVTLQAIYAPAEQDGEPLAGEVHWSFGDGTTGASPALSFGGPCGSPTLADTAITNCPKTGPAYVQHEFPVGTFHVSVTGADTLGRPVSYSLVVTVYPRLRVGWRVVRRHGAWVTLEAVAHGGDGRLLAARWRFPGGSRAEGLIVIHRFARGRRVRARVWGVE
jgi:hypothetical protein